MMRLTLADAVKFHLAGDPMSGTPVFAEKRKWAPDERWAVTRAGSCLNKGGGWEYEPSPSSRTEAFFERTRWATAEAAAEAYLATQAERERASLARGSGPGNSADREGTHAPSHPIPPSVSAAHFDQPSDGDLYLSDRETLEKLLRDVDTERFKSGFGLISFEESDAIRRLLEENKRLRGLLEAQEKSRVSVEEWSQEKSSVIDRLTAQRDERLKAALEDMKKHHRAIRIWPVCECLGCEALKGEK